MMIDVLLMNRKRVGGEERKDIVSKVNFLSKGEQSRGRMVVL